MIRLEGLRVQAGEFLLAIDDLSIAPGEYVMVLGPTASGKTVLLETVAGLRRPLDGRVWFGERDITGEPPERRGAGLVYQDYALFPHLTVAENIDFGPRSRRAHPPAGSTSGRHGAAAGVGRRRGAGAGRSQGQDGRVRELAGLLGIESLLGRYPEGLSGGERQRVALARALAIEPEVLLLDEPLSALDGPTRLELQAELKHVHRQLGATVMHVTHDLDEALALGDRVAVLIGGVLRQIGVPQHVTRAPADVGVARLVGLTNVLPIATMLEEGSNPGRDEDERDGLRRHGGPRAGVWHVRLKSGPEILAEGVGAARSSGDLFAVIRADEIALAPLGEPQTGSPWEVEAPGVAASENVLEGSVRAVQVQSMHASVEVEVSPVGTDSAPLVLTVHVLRPQVERMGIADGLPVRLRFRGSAVHVCPGAGHSPAG